MSTIGRILKNSASTLIVVAVIAAIAWLAWQPLSGWISGDGQATAADAHEEHDHGAETDVIVLSDSAKENIDLKVGRVRLSPYERTISVPGIVTERPGITSNIISAPLAGFVVDVLALPGEAVNPGTPLFVLQLTNEDLVQAQTDFLSTQLAIDVEQKEIARLNKIAEGAIAEKVIITRQYELEKLQGQLLAQRQRLLLHGLNDEQIDSIAKEHRLLREFLIRAPQPHDATDPEHLSDAHPRLLNAMESVDPESLHAEEVTDIQHALVIDEIPVRKGQMITEGEQLAVLADLSELYISGAAYERDADALVQAAANDWKVTAVSQTEGIASVANLDLAYVANDIDRESRTLPFFVNLPNELQHQTKKANNRVIPSWKFKPGQRMEIRVPVERWTDQIVLPTTAVVEDGLERYVFSQNGKSFRRKPVHVIYRGPDTVVVRNDGQLRLGETVVLNAAHQLQMALKAQASGGADPHAGHMH